MQRKTVLLCALAVALSIAPGARAQSSNQSATENRSSPSGPRLPNNARFGIPTGIARVYQNYLYGVVSKTEPGALVLVKTKFGVPSTIHVDKKTKYVRNGKRSTLGAIKAGDQVYVDLKTNKKTGDMLAKKVVSGIGATGGTS
ncbi:MAG: hypothetical protein ACRD1N_01675 [Terriglobia bacterium]